MSEPERLRQEIRRLERELHSAKTNLNVHERQCPHDWTSPEYTPERTESYTTPGDPPGTMGVDWRGPVHVPATTKDKWTRRCRKCGKTETTTPFTLGPEAVYQRVIHALESKRPQARYYVTFPTYVVGFMKRILPTALFDKLLRKLGS